MIRDGKIGFLTINAAKGMLEGGEPIVYQGQVVGAVGVSGTIFSRCRNCSACDSTIYSATDLNYRLNSLLDEISRETRKKLVKIRVMHCNSV
jgi:hypothetical protein